MDPIEKEMHQLINKYDEEYEEKLKKILEDNEKIGSFSKVWPFNSPKILVLPAILGSIMKGLTMPIYGIVFSRVMTILTVPPEDLDRIHGHGYAKN